MDRKAFISLSYSNTKKLKEAANCLLEKEFPDPRDIKAAKLILEVYEWMLNPQGVSEETHKEGMIISTEKLTLLLAKNNMTQKELAEKSGVAESTISNLLTGKTKPTYTSVNRLVKALDVQVEELI